MFNLLGSAMPYNLTVIIKAALYFIQEKNMVVYVEAKVMDEPMLVNHRMFHNIKDKICTFKEGKPGQLQFIVM